jgi:DNA-binding transcriptional LysR family regulator
MLNIHQLNVFVIAAETLNFTQTAKRLHLTQSSVSQHIKSLETQIGMELFIRRGRALQITEAGEILLPLAQEIVEDSIQAIEQMELLKTEVHGNLLIGCNTALGKYVLPILLAEFQKRFPLIKITCSRLSLQDTITLLSKGEIHFALTNMEDSCEDSGEFQLFTKEPVVLIAPKGHPWSQKREIYTDDLYDEGFIMREPQSDLYKVVKKDLMGVGVDIDKLNTRMVMGTSEAIALTVEQGGGCGFVSRMVANKTCGKRVDVINVHGLSIFLEIYFGRQIAHPGTGAQAAFWDFITRQYSNIYKMMFSTSKQ